MKIQTDAAFTLIEFIIVLAILGIVLAIAAPNFIHNIHNTNLKTAGRDLSGDIAFIKQSAASEAVHYKISFDKDANEYSILKGGTNIDNVYNVLIAKKSPRSAAPYVSIDNITYTQNEIVFQPRGITSSGSVTLKNDKDSKITITTTLVGKVSVKNSIK